MGPYTSYYICCIQSANLIIILFPCLQSPKTFCVATLRKVTGSGNDNVVSFYREVYQSTIDIDHRVCS